MKAPQEYVDPQWDRVINIKIAMMDAWIAGAVAAGMRQGMAKNYAAKAFDLLELPQDGFCGC